ncbi:roadblock/LC7 domain-containing protein [Amycolatopsis sp. NPDC006131]|uniref:roadblock/LC7 domain-containing protein n=1 Tax=Amycolatopsis sp. NPDC006131 TaxID=3156731 RepID=UPI0033BF5E90
MIIEGLVRELPQVRHAVLLSADGLVLDHSAGLDPTDAEYLASMAAVLQSLALRVSNVLDGGASRQVVVRCDRIALVVLPWNAHERLAVATAEADLDEIIAKLDRAAA